jgi:hypothetical protein
LNSSFAGAASSAKIFYHIFNSSLVGATSPEIFFNIPTCIQSVKTRNRQRLTISSFYFESFNFYGIINKNITNNEWQV